MLKNYNLLDKENNNSSNGSAFAEAKIISNKFRPQTAALANAKPAQSPLTEYSEARRIHTEADIERINRETQRKKESWGLN
jgi:hypothetical protein